MAHILLVEDDEAIAELFSVNLKYHGFDYSWASSGEAAQKKMNEFTPDLVLLDWMLPQISGIQLMKLWRENDKFKEIAIIMITARSEEHDLIKALDAGADDYIIKPFSIQEVLARIRALLRRKSPQTLEDEIEIEGLNYNPQKLNVSFQGKKIKLSRTEGNLLKYLMCYKNKIHSRGKLLDKIWGDHVFIEERTVDVHIKRLRKNLRAINAEHLIQTIRGVGYGFVTDIEPK